MNKKKIIGILLSAVMLLNLNIIGVNAAKSKKVVTKSKTITKTKKNIVKPKIVIKKSTSKVNSHILTYIKGVNFKSIAYGNKIYVAVGNNGTVMTSNNLGLWKFKKITANNINSVVYAKYTFVMVGDNGLILTSKDGTTWKQIKSNIADNINKVIFANNKFIAVGDGGTILISKDGLVWDASQTDDLEDKLTSVAYNGSIYCIGDGNCYHGGIYSSKDLENFKREDCCDGIKNIVYTHNKFFAVATRDVSMPMVHNTYSTLFVSKDGVNWEHNDYEYNDFVIDSIFPTSQEVYFVGRLFSEYLDSGWYFADMSYMENYNDGADYPSDFTISDKKGHDLSKQHPAINSVLEVNKKYIGVSDNTTVFESSDGVNWKKQDISIIKQ